LSMQCGAGLAAVAMVIGEMRTEVPPLDGGAGGCQLPSGLAVHRSDLFFGEQAPGDARLVGDDDACDAQVTELPQCVPDAGQQASLRGVAEIPRIIEQRPVAIEERGTPHGFGSAGGGASGMTRTPSRLSATVPETARMP